jgi:hypothetical protein
MEELELRWKSGEYLTEWLISFYRERMLYFMDNIGARTEYNTVITPRLVRATMTRYAQLIEEKHDIDRRLS